ncbi:unnamed protein product [Microthlaspi erraticum]|uniref:DUF1985 domain-containing protein n=1 Tax=Microthlaspi erraticum TaxID=1685480 RepID=A0A6D2IX18_9BRAS|nr:unnamed protein product [Microthlaspi erraticum]
MDSELPKRLCKEGTEPQVEKINKCSKLSILKVLKAHMETELNDVKKDPIFAHILAIYENRLGFSRTLIHSFMCRQLLTYKNMNSGLCLLGGRCVFLCKSSMRSPASSDDDGNNEVEKWDDDGGFWSKLLKKKGKISMTMIRERHVLQAHKWTRVDRLTLVYVSVIAGVLLAVDEKTAISHDYIKLVMDFEKLRAYPWGLHSFDHLVNGVVKARADLWKPKSYVLEGFSYALQIWIMEAIPDLGVSLGKKLNEISIVTPRCSN